jgi:enamine deaminase RidA (YjgF/YER057c/UK114 family)
MTGMVLSGAPWESSYGYSRARRVGDFIFVAGTGPVSRDGAPPPESAADQATLCFTIIEAALLELGASLNDVISTRFYLTDEADFDAVGLAHGAVFHDIKPVCAGVVVAGLRIPTWKVEIEAVASAIPIP